MEATYSLAPMQHGLLFHHLSSPQGGSDLEQIVCTLREELDVEALRRAWERVVARHAVLRTRFRWEGLDDPVQEVASDVSLPLHTEDWRDLTEAEREARLAAFLDADREQGFDLGETPLLRIAVLRLGDAHHEVVWSFPHIILDGYSFPIVLREVFAFYAAECRGESLELPLPRPYREHVEALADRDPTSAREFWRERLAGFSEPTPLPGAPGAATGRGERELAIDPATTAALRALAEREQVTLGTLVQGAWALLLARYAGTDEVVIGATRAGRAGSVEGAEAMVGLFINTLPVRVPADGSRRVGDWLRELRANDLAARPHEHAPLVEIQAASDVRAGAALFESILVYDNALLDTTMRASGDEFASRQFRLHERTNYPLTLYGYGEDALLLKLAFDEPRYDADGADRMLGQLVRLLEGMAQDSARTLGSLPLLTEAEEQALRAWNDTGVEVPTERCIHQLIEEQARRTPHATAVALGAERIRYAELDERANRLAQHLRGLGVGPDVRVGICTERSLDLVVGLLGIHKAGGAYVPLDPSYPADRIAFMLEDARVPVLLTQAHLEAELPPHQARVVRLDADWPAIERESSECPASGVTPEHLAYVIYTSGSTGRPKGVMVEHRNVVNFFTGMDARIPHDPPGVWLAVTSLSFDISVLELFWTLARGFEVVLHEDEGRAAAAERRIAAAGQRPLDFGLMYFASDEGASDDKYRLLLEGAKFADAHGFSSVWTPERHFHAFGGLFPNPAVTGAAVAAVTNRVGIRAGSVVLPLHHPTRVAEEWAVVDNLSHGRVGISIAAGWQPRDFVIKPESHAEARKLMYDHVETIRRLWRGEAVPFPGPTGEAIEVSTLPRPVQRELPVWVTSAGSPETYEKAGEIGANVLTHLLGQSIDEVAEKITLYREAWRKAGHPGEGQVTLMLHTFIGDDLDHVREAVRRPMMDYLGSAVGLVKGFASSWTAYKKRADGTTEADLDLDSLSDDEMEGLLEYSFERYFETSALFGTPESCLPMLDRIRAIGVDEVACLIDFGVAQETVLTHLAHLNRLRDLEASRAQGLDPLSERPASAEGARSEPQASEVNQDASDSAEGRLPAQITRHGVTHLQCTPSLASMLVADEASRAALGRVRTLMIGGEAFPPTLAAQLRECTAADIVNMYGPTETTIWSSTHAVEADGEVVPIGRPIANTQLYVLDAERRPLPIGVPGELYIGGDGVVRGYLDRPELTAERFLPDPFRDAPGARLYRTGDLARFRTDGTLEFLGRIDHQVKIRGHRIELGEIEADLTALESVREAVVMPREDTPGDLRLVAYVIPASGATAEPAALREALRQRLPEPMVPAHYVSLETFPLTPNKKIDRKALPPPGEVERVAGAALVLASSEIEKSIVTVWQQVLGVSQVGLDDNFFDLGGHSLLAVKAHRSLRELAPRPFSITDLFRFPTVRALAEFLGDDGSGPGLQQSQDRADQRRQAMAQRRARRGQRGGSGGAGR
ncbi:MAG: LLM class flavin-dependent oxidoreductase [Myxococcota bacterium]|nr:LLM class flavin-dependent oxidoreductase [Myxococcota bacterium]